MIGALDHLTAFWSPQPAAGALESSESLTDGADAEAPASSSAGPTSSIDGEVDEPASHASSRLTGQTSRVGRRVRKPAQWGDFRAIDRDHDEPMSSSPAPAGARAPSPAPTPTPKRRRRIRKSSRWDDFEVDGADLGRDYASDDPPASPSPQPTTERPQQPVDPRTAIQLPPLHTAPQQAMAADDPDALSVPTSFAQLVDQHETLFERLRRQARPTEVAIAAANPQIDAYVRLHYSRKTEWTSYQRAMLSLEISPVPVTDVRIAIHLALSIDAFGSPVLPHLRLNTTSTKANRLRTLARIVNDLFQCDDQLDAAASELLDSVAAAVSVPERSKSMRGARDAAPSEQTDDEQENGEAALLRGSEGASARKRPRRTDGEGSRSRPAKRAKTQTSSDQPRDLDSRLAVRMPDTIVLDESLPPVLEDAFEMPTDFAQLMERHDELLDRLRRQPRPSADQIARVDRAIDDHAHSRAGQQVGLSSRLLDGWTAYQDAMLGLRISPVPLTHLKVAVYCASAGSGFGSLHFNEATSKVRAVRRLRSVVNAHLTLDPVLDAEVEGLVTEVLRAVSLPDSKPEGRPPDSTIGLDDGRRKTRSGGVRHAPNSTVSARELRKLRTASATVGRALVVLGAVDDDDAALEDCGTVENVFDKFAELRRSWRGDDSPDLGDGDDVDGVPIEDDLDGRSLDDNVDGVSIDGLDEA